MAELSSPLKVGDFELKNRLVMAPLTRSRSGESRVPNALMKEYYQQRANAGLILTEATVISPKAVGYEDTPGLWTEEQAHAWQPIIQAVHAQGAKIVAQLWHVGRISDPQFLDGDLGCTERDSARRTCQPIASETSLCDTARIIARRN